MSKNLRNFIRSITPSFALEAFRRRKKKKVNQALEEQRKAGNGISQEQLEVQLLNMGIAAGDILLVHTAMSKIGSIEGGPKTLIAALKNVLGNEGTLCMPSSPNPALQLEFVKSNTVFDRANSPSLMGKITEVFRQQEGVVRSFHPTEPVCAWGKHAEYIVADHFGELTPYTKQSPFFRISELKGKIAYVGVTLINAGTNLHTLEDAVDFPYPVYVDETFTVQMVDVDGTKHQMKTKVHNPTMSAKRKCDGLLPLFEAKGAMQRHALGNAPVLLFDAFAFFNVMVDQFKTNGVTMYTPNGEEL